MAAYHGDRLVDGGAFGVADLVEVAVNAGDQPPDPGDCGLARGGVAAGLLIDTVDGSGETFAGAEQDIEVDAQVGQVGHDGAEVVATAQPNRTGQASPPRGDVGWFGARHLRPVLVYDDADAKILENGEGTNEIHRNIIGRTLIRQGC